MTGLIFLGLCLASGLIAGYILVVTQIEMRRIGSASFRQKRATVFIQSILFDEIFWARTK